MQVRDVLKAKGAGARVITTGPDSSAREAIAVMVRHNVGSLPVVESSGRLLGVISERDLIRAIDHAGPEFAEAPVRELMTRDPITCELDDEVDAVMGLMSDRRIAKVPTLENGRLVGIISVGDVIKLLYERTRSENSYLMDYLYGPAHA
jgi:CBS domain-containing protein